MLPALFASSALLMAAAIKRRENALEDATLVADTHQNLSYLYSLDIYGSSACYAPAVHDLIFL
jgi:hypothetical protein